MKLTLFRDKHDIYDRSAFQISVLNRDELNYASILFITSIFFISYNFFYFYLRIVCLSFLLFNAKRLLRIS